MKRSRYNEEDFNDFVKELLATGNLTKIQSGVTKFYLSQGYSALSEKQKHVFDFMIDKNSVSECQHCCGDIPWCEMAQAMENGGLCNHCQRLWEEIDNE